MTNGFDRSSEVTIPYVATYSSMAKSSGVGSSLLVLATDDDHGFPVNAIRDSRRPTQEHIRKDWPRVLGVAENESDFECAMTGPPRPTWTHRMRLYGGRSDWLCLHAASREM
ncbi:hypothetical protein Ae201684P_002193 [Aphanomyces euteiches]|nr:hypothetical protein Ae201684P_002193 [Aphanomyces euteiches]